MHSDQEPAFSEIRDVLANFNLGELLSIERNERGYINTSYGIETIHEGDRHRYFFRKYKSGIQEPEIQFEHSVIKHLLAKDFSLIAKVFESKQGMTYIKYFTGEDKQFPAFCAIFEYLKGDDKYDCVDPHPSLVEINNSAVVQAEFHDAGANFSPHGQRFEPKILDLISKIANKIKHNLQSSKGTAFDDYLGENESYIRDNCDEAQNYFAELDTSNWEEILIHCDFHPGNLKFDGENVIGLFDFDWSKIDLRIFDVALAIWYFFTSWCGEQDGILRIDEANIYLYEYQTAFRELPNLDPIVQDELQHFPMMINLGNLYVLNWAVTDFYANEVDPVLYLQWLKHCIKFAEWFSLSGKQLIEQDMFKS